MLEKKKNNPKKERKKPTKTIPREPTLTRMKKTQPLREHSANPSKNPQNPTS
jgi:hypothetical protein